MKCPYCKSERITFFKSFKMYFCMLCQTFFPHNTILLHDSRKELVKALAEEYEYACISKQDIINELIDIELYNQKVFMLRKNKKLFGE